MPSCPGGVRRVVWGYRNEEDEMNFELLIGMGTLVMGFGIIVYGAIAREHPLLCLFGLGVAALGASQAVVQVVPPGPARFGVRSFFALAGMLAFFLVWRMARNLGRERFREGTPGQESSAK